MTVEFERILKEVKMVRLSSTSKFTQRDRRERKSMNDNLEGCEMKWLWPTFKVSPWYLTG
jgi:hypothetical protein